MRQPLSIVLTYHSISEGPAPLHTSPRRFAAQLDLLLRAGFQPVPLRALLESLAADRPATRPRFALTFDDGYLDFAEAALPLLERRRLPATVFVTASAAREGLPGGLAKALLPLEQLAALRERGVEIGAHSIGHRDLTALDDQDLEREVALCRRILEQHAGQGVREFAYPFGHFDARVGAVVAKHFSAAVTSALAPVRRGADPFAIPRVDAYYLRSTLLRFLLSHGRPEPYLWVRRWLRRLRGTEPRRVPKPERRRV